MSSGWTCTFYINQSSEKSARSLSPPSSSDDEISDSSEDTSSPDGPELILSGLSLARAIMRHMLVNLRGEEGAGCPPLHRFSASPALAGSVHVVRPGQIWKLIV